MAFQEGVRVGVSTGDEPHEPVEMVGPRSLVTHDARSQVGVVVYIRAIAVGVRYAFVWLDAHPRSLVVGSVHMQDAWSADAEPYCRSGAILGGGLGWAAREQRSPSEETGM